MICSNSFFNHRVREISDKKPESMDMFHIPFELRHKVDSYRHSINGLPGLYLENSPYIALKETGFLRNNHKKIYISKFKLNDIKKVKMYDLFSNYDEYSNKLEIKYSQDIESRNKYIEKFNKIEISTRIINYSIIAACSVQKKIIDSSNYKYKEEYIIPKLLLQFVTQEDGIDGIRYLSTIRNNKDEYEDSQNYVFPASIAQKKKGHCPKLLKNFNVFEPKDCTNFINI